MTLALLLTTLLAGAAPAAPTVTTKALTAAPKGLKVPGRFHAGLAYADAAGEHVVVLSTKDGPGSRHLFATQAKKVKGGFQIIRTVKDWATGCEFDLLVDFQDAVFLASDVDADGRAEVTFGYRLGCVSDVSPVPQKLILLEGPDKHAARGETRVQTGEAEWTGGAFTLDDGLDPAGPLGALLAERWRALLAASP